MKNNKTAIRVIAVVLALAMVLPMLGYLIQ